MGGRLAACQFPSRHLSHSPNLYRLCGLSGTPDRKALMRRHLLLALLLCTLAIPAHAGTKGCPFLNDPRGDVSVVPLGQGGTAADRAGARPGEDILSSDVWADSSNAQTSRHVVIGAPGCVS